MAAEMPHLPHQLSEALAARCADVSADARDERLAYLNRYGARQRSRRHTDGAT
jgi:hypothetical protein